MPTIMIMDCEVPPLEEELEHHFASKIGTTPDRLSPLARKLLYISDKAVSETTPFFRKYAEEYHWTVRNVDACLRNVARGIQHVHDIFGCTADIITISDHRSGRERRRVIADLAESVSVTADNELSQELISLHPKIVSLLGNGESDANGIIRVTNANLPKLRFTPKEAAVVVGLEEAHHAYWKKTFPLSERALKKGFGWKEVSQIIFGKSFAQAVEDYALDPLEREAATFMREAVKALKLGPYRSPGTSISHAVMSGVVRSPLAELVRRGG